MIYHFITRDPAKCRIILTEPANLSGRAYSTAVCINPDCNHHPWIPRLTSSHTFHCFYSIIEWLEILPSDEFPNRSHRVCWTDRCINIHYLELDLFSVYFLDPDFVRSSEGIIHKSSP